MRADGSGSRWKRVPGVVLHPIAAGVAIELLLTAHVNRVGPTAERALGSQGAVITALIDAHYGGYTHRLQGAVVLMAVALGVGLGVVAELLLSARQRLTGVRFTAVGRWGRAGVLIVLVHGLCLGLSMSRWPQLYVESFASSAGRWWQELWTERLREPGAVGLGLVGVGWALGLPGSGRRLGRWARRWARRWGRALLLGATGAVVLGLLGWGLPRAVRATASSDPRPDVVVLGVDSMRWDHFRPEVMPHLSALASGGTLFTRAYVTLPRTFPSWVTLLTGVSPHRHGVRSMFPRWEERATTPPMLPGALRAAGYRTVVVSDFAGDVFPRVDAGFDVSVAPRFDFRALMAQRALEGQVHLLPFLHTRPARRWLPVLREFSHAADPFLLARDALEQLERGDARPQLTVVFFSTAHFPYAAPQERASVGGYQGRFRYHKPATLEESGRVDEADQAQVRALYARSLGAVDRAAASVIEGVRRARRGRPTVFVVLADHGEHLFERGRGQGHGDHLQGDEVLHVPLVLAGAGIPARREERLVRDVDLAPTLAQLASIPWVTAEGRALLDPAPSTPRHAFAETGLWFTARVPGVEPHERLPYPPMSALLEVDREHGDELVLRREWQAPTTAAKHRMVRDERYKLVFLPSRAGPLLRLFDTVVDPFEQDDLAAREPATVRRLRGALCGWMGEAQDEGTRLARRELGCEGS